MTVEINSTDSPYFERAICFVRPQFAASERLDLHREASELIGELDMQIEAKPHSDAPAAKRALPRWVTGAAAGAAGLAAGVLLAVIF